MMETVMTTGAMRRAKLQSTNTSFLQDGCPSCCPTNSIKAIKATFGDFYHLFYTQYALRVAIPAVRT